jgi:hypothetical protein
MHRVQSGDPFRVAFFWPTIWPINAFLQNVTERY